MLGGMTELYKTFKPRKNICSCIHPISWHSAQKPDGVPFSSSGFIVCLAKMKVDGIYPPNVLKKTSAVVSIPRSDEKNASNCLLHIVLNFDLEASAIPVSMQL
jgi:hypothetical protein